MESALDVRLRVLIPIVENSISARAMRPGDILKSRKGLTVEIGNTDAEGRLILADALALAAEEAPDLMLDFATLTGAARAALAPICRHSIPTTMRSRGTWRTTPSAAAIPSGPAALATLPIRCWRAPSPTSHAPATRSRVGDGGPVPAALPEDPNHGRISTSTPGIESRARTGRRAARRVGARAVRPVAHPVSGVRKAPSPALHRTGLGWDGRRNYDDPHRSA